MELTADFLNNTASNLGATGGFLTGSTYYFEDLNGITQNALTAGVTQDNDKCEVVLVGEQIKVKQGTVIFASGAFMKVPSAGIFLDYTLGVKNYIYAINDAIKGTLYCETSTVYPIGDFVLLGEIADTTLTDKRQYSYGKVIGFGINLIEKFDVLEVYPGEAGVYKLVDTLALTKSHKRAVFKNNINSGAYIAFVDLENQLYNFSYGNNIKVVDGASGVQVTTSTDNFLKFILNGTNLEIYYKANFQGSSYTADFAIEVY